MVSKREGEDLRLTAQAIYRLARTGIGGEQLMDVEGEEPLAIDPLR
jgi:hypothetical protein